MKNRPRFLLLPSLLLAALGTACAAPMVLVGVGAAVGIWTYDSFTDDRGEVLLAAPPERVFAAAENYVRTREEIRELEVKQGTRLITWKEGKNLEMGIIVSIVPGSPEYSNLKVFAAEYGVRGRSDLAKQIAEEIAARV